MKKKLIVFLGVAFVFALAASAGAITYTYTDSGVNMPSAGGTNPITYSLSIDTTTWIATLDVATSSDVSPDWHLMGFAHKYSSNTDIALNAISGFITGSSWSVGTSTSEVPWAGGGTNTFFSDNFDGFWTTRPKEDGLLLTGGSGTSSATFSITGLTEAQLFSGGLPFKAVFLDDPLPSGFEQFDQLSQVASVPEPTTILLLGSGLLGLAAFGRRKLKKN